MLTYLLSVLVSLAGEGYGVAILEDCCTFDVLIFISLDDGILPVTVCQGDPKKTGTYPRFKVLKC